MLQVKPEYAAIESAEIMEPGADNSFAREHYAEDIEKGVNEQINTVRACRAADRLCIAVLRLCKLLCHTNTTCCGNACVVAPACQLLIR